MRWWIGLTLVLIIQALAVGWVAADAWYGWPAGLLGAGLGVSHVLAFSIGRAAPFASKRRWQGMTTVLADGTKVSRCVDCPACDDFKGGAFRPDAKAVATMLMWEGEDRCRRCAHRASHNQSDKEES